MYAGMALATLTKGPIGFLLPGLVMVLFLAYAKGWREIKNMKVFSGGLLFAAICVPWYAAMWQLHGSASGALSVERAVAALFVAHA